MSESPEMESADNPERAESAPETAAPLDSQDAGSVEPAGDSSVARPPLTRLSRRVRPAPAGPEGPPLPEGLCWYILHTLSGNEEKVRQNLLITLSREGLGEMVEDVLIPVEDMVEVKRGKKHIKKRKLFPGYVFVRMKATEPVLKQIRRLPNLARFVGGIGGSGPVPVSDAEISRIRHFMTETKEKPKIIYEVEEVVRIINGPFMDFNGTIQELDVDRGKLKIQVEIFGRATPVVLDFDQVEKV